MFAAQACRRCQMTGQDFFNQTFIRLEDTVREHGDSLTARHLFSVLIDVPQMQTYLADFYAADFSSYLYDWLNIFRADRLTSNGNFKRDDNGEGIYKRFARVGDVRRDSGARKDDVYPLTVEEMREAEKYYSRSEGLFVALAGFQAGVSEYFKDLTREGEARTWGVSTEAKDFILTQTKLCARNASGLSFWHDLYPVMLSSLHERAVDLQGTDVQKALTQGFKKAVFHSFGYEEQENEVVLVEAPCPFAKAIGHLFQTKLIEDADGELSVSDDKEPGALILFLANRGDALLDLRPHLRKAPDGTDDPVLLYGQ